MRVVIEFESVVCVMIKINYCVKFFMVIGLIYEVFFVYNKSVLYELKIVEKVISLVCYCKIVLEEYVY